MLESERLEISQYFLNRYITLLDEKLIFTRRKSLAAIFLPIFSVILAALLFSLILALIIHYFLASYFLLLIAVDLVIFQIALGLVTKIIIDWYFHVYLITNRKFLDISYKPLFYHRIKDMPLDQVRCLEVVVRKKGILKEILNIGDVVFNLDMLTHHDIFTLVDISNPHKIGVSLGDSLNGIISVRNTTSTNEPVQLQMSRISEKTIYKFRKPVFTAYTFGG